MQQEMTSDFGVWLEMVGPSQEDYGEVYSLFLAVSEEQEDDFFKCWKYRGQWFVKSNTMDYTLRIPTEAARQEFLRRIEDRYCGDLDVESWYHCQRNIDNPHA